MADQTQRLEIATVRAEVGSNILYLFSNAAEGAQPIATESGEIKNLKQVIAAIQDEAAEKISVATTIFQTAAAGLAATADGGVYLVQSPAADMIYTVWKNQAGSAVNTGKTAMSSQAIQDALTASNEAAQAAEEAADIATSRTAGFLQPAAEPPTSRDDGLPLQVGDRYFNTVDQAEYLFQINGWASNDSLEAISNLEALITATPAPGKIPQADEGGRLNLGWLPDSLRKAAILGEVVFTPAMFGVTGDSTTDYTENIRRMHAAANAIPGSKVVYAGVGTINIQANASILINSDTDFSGSFIKLIGGMVSPLPDDRLNRLFYVNDPSLASFTVPLIQSELTEGASQFTVPDTVGCGLLKVDSNKRVGSRTTAPTKFRYYTQVFALERGGVLVPGGLDTDLVSNSVTATFYPAPKNWIKIRGLSADEQTFNNQELLVINRSMVVVECPVCEPTGKNATPESVNYLLRILTSMNVVVTNSCISAQSAIGVSTYGINVNACANVWFEKAFGGGRNTWGIMITNYVNGLYINDCHLNRFDTHEGAHNVFIKGGSLNGYPYQYGWGGGQILMDGVTINSNSPTLRARTDYDNNFNGSIRLKNIHYNLGRISANPNTGIFEMAPIFDAEKLGGDAGSVRWANDIEISDITVNFVGDGDILLCRPFNAALINSSVAVQAPNRISIRRIKSSRKRMIISIDPAFQSFNAPESGRCKISLEEFETTPSPTYPTLNRANPVSGYAAAGGGYDVIINRVKNYSQYFAAPKNSAVDIYNSTITAIRSFSGTSSGQKINIYSSEIANTISLAAGGQGELGAGTAELSLRDCIIRSNANIAAATALNGLLIATGVTCALPSGVTVSTAFTGYKSSSLYQA
ncbi:hypothetical protein ASF66_01125 [Pseudomonas sp. Leaf129]|uniref:hypothetical protein n=1 Tax=Pseudomonas sp. Leaf129 TaxID=1736268 RepID=UPI0007028E30|nr:hypothetical protein [Pseudomonas sp. Leaf129]KQQ62987.1 hypothetical protein ASF66_01125 [Pseudomonas sp. Leaf129]